MMCRLRLWLKVRSAPYYVTGVVVLALLLTSTLEMWHTARTGATLVERNTEKAPVLFEDEGTGRLQLKKHHFENSLTEELANSRKSEGTVEASHSMDRQASAMQSYHGDGTDTGCQRATLSPCQVIQVAIACSGFAAGRDVTTLIKSVLFHTHHPIHLHFLADGSTRSVLSTLFRTWQLPEVQVSYYTAEDWTSEVEFIPSRDSSQNVRMIKLLMTSVLPSDVEKVIVLDVDLTFAADIADLWLQFKALVEQSKSIGLVENQSDWYLGPIGQDVVVWPALGRGYNTGVMLLRLDELRRLGWMRRWKTVADKYLTPRGAAPRADQDIVNAVLNDHPDMHLTLPCSWNLQLSAHALSEACYSKTTASDLKVIHWNSPERQAVRARNVEYFRSLRTTFVEYDGNLLRHRLPSGCSESESAAADSTEAPAAGPDECRDFLQAGQVRYRTHLYFLNYERPPSDAHDVALVAQLSHDRFHILEALCDHWQGPMSLALFLSDSEAEQFLEFARESTIISNRTNIGFHVVYRSGAFYPVNYLRNTALDQVQQPYVFLADIDFLPMHSLYTHLKATLADLDAPRTRKALLVPAFETLLYRMPFPESKQSLVTMLDEQKVFPFHQHLWPRGHSPTNFDRWRTSTAPYRVKWAADFEPYLVVPTSVTRYDTRFVGFGWNKVSHIMELEAQKYEFHVLPDAFTIHMPHALSLDNARFFSKGRQYRGCMGLLRSAFQEDLQKKYGLGATRRMFGKHHTDTPPHVQV